MRHREDQTADRRSGERDTAARGQAALFQKVADMYLVAVVVLGFHLRGDAAQQIGRVLLDEFHRTDLG